MRKWKPSSFDEGAVARGPFRRPVGSGELVAEVRPPRAPRFCGAQTCRRIIVCEMG